MGCGRSQAQYHSYRHVKREEETCTTSIVCDQNTEKPLSDAEGQQYPAQQGESPVRERLTGRRQMAIIRKVGGQPFSMYAQNADFLYPPLYAWRAKWFTTPPPGPPYTHSNYW